MAGTGILSLEFLLFWLGSAANPEHVAIGMAKVHLANIPGPIGRRKGDFQPGGAAPLVHLVHVVHPDRHPDALICLFISVLLKRGGVRAAAAASLCPLTKKDASYLARSNRAKCWRRSPVPQFVPSPLLKPRNRAGDVGYVQYRSQPFGFHNHGRIALPRARDLAYRLRKNCFLKAQCLRCVTGHKSASTTRTPFMEGIPSLS